MNIERIIACDTAILHAFQKCFVIKIKGTSFEKLINGGVRTNA